MPLVSEKGSDDPRQLSRYVLCFLGIVTGYTALHGGGFDGLPEWVAAFIPIALFFLLLTNKNRKFLIPRGSLIAVWILLFIWMCCSSIFSLDSNSSVGAILSFMGLLIAGLLAFSLPDSESTIDRFIAILLLGTACVTIFGWIIYLLGRFTVQGGHEMIRHFIGPFFWKNPMGGYLILFLPLAIISAIKYRRTASWLSTILAILMLGGLILTRSRGSWIALVIVITAIFIPVLIIRKMKLKKWLVVLAIVVVGFLLGIVLAPPSALEERAKSIAVITSPEIEGQSSTERVAMLRAGLEIIKDYPVFGVGANCWPYIRTSYLTELRFIPKYPHNMYLKTTAELGIPGFIIFMIALVLSYFPLLISAFRKKTGLLIVGIATGIGASLIHMAVDFDAAFAGIVFPLVLLGGLGHRLRAVEIGNLKELQFPRVVLLPIFGILSLLLVARGYSEIKLEEARRYIELLENEKAMQSLKTAILLNPISWEAHYDLSRILYQEGENKSSIEELKKTINIAPSVSEVHGSMGFMQAIIGDTSRAIEYYNNSIALSPGSAPDNYFELAEIYRGMGKPEDAARILLSLTDALYPHSGRKYTNQTASYKYNIAEAWRQLEEIYHTMGDSAGVLIASEKAERFGRLREKDYPLSMMGIETNPPEMVVKNFFEAINSSDTCELRSLVLDEEAPLPRVSEGLKLEFDRVLRIAEDPIGGKATVEFVMERTDSIRSVKVPSSLKLVLSENNWKITFKEEQ